jgi:hypothetical protein
LNRPLAHFRSAQSDCERDIKYNEQAAPSKGMTRTGSGPPLRSFPKIDSSSATAAGNPDRLQQSLATSSASLEFILQNAKQSQPKPKKSA